MDTSSNSGRNPVSMKSLARVLSKLAPPNPNCSNYDGLTQQVLPLFKFLRLLGQCPFSFERVENHRGTRRIHYEFKVCRNPGFVLSALSALFITGCAVIGVIHSQTTFSLFGDLWPQATIPPYMLSASQSRLENMSSIILVTFEIIYTLVGVVEFIIIWLTSPTLCKWLNEWNDIENEMDNCPGMVSKSNFANFWKYFAIPYIIIPTIALGTPISVTEWVGKYPVGIIMTFVFAYISTACLHTQDVKVIVMFKAIEMGFKQVRQAIQLRYDAANPHKNLETLERQEIRDWKRILYKIRRQSEVAGRYMAVHQLISIATCIFFAAAAMFVSSNLIGEHPDNETIPLVVIFTVISLFRVITKIIMAVRITEEERRLASLLKDFEFVEEKEECQLEMKWICDLLIYSPTEISLNSYVRLNNSLILGICGQVLTQFIVYQQTISKC